MKEILNKLASTIENPGFYKPLTPEEQAELFLYLFAPKKKVLRKPEVIKGIDGVTPTKDKDYLSKEASEKLIAELASKTKAELEALVATKLANVTNGKDGRDAVITDALVERIAELAQSMIVLPDFATLITMEPEAIRDSLELLPDGEKLAQEAIEGLPEDLDKIRADIKRNGNAIIGGLTRGGVEQIVNDAIADIDASPSFETYSKNLKAYPAVLAYTGDNLTSITYDLGGGLEVLKTLAYTGDDLTSVTLSGDVPVTIDTVKTLSYTGVNLTGVTYS